MKRFLVLSLAVLLSTPGLWSEKSGSPSNPDQELEQLYGTARRLYSRKDYPSARAVFRQVRDLRNDYQLVNQYLTAIDRKISGKGAAIDSRQLKSIYEEARSLLKKDQLEEARKLFLTVASVDPAYRSTEGYLAKIQKALPGTSAKAPAQAGTPAKVKPSPAESKARALNALLDKARTFEEQGQIDGALPLVVEVLKKDPENAQAKRQLDRLQKQVRQAVAAQKNAADRQAGLLSKSEIKAAGQTADKLFKEGRLPEARAAYAKVLRAEPSNTVAAAMLHVIDRQAGKKGAAVAKMHPSSRGALLNRARDLKKEKQWAAAKLVLTTILQEDPSNMEAKYLLDLANAGIAREKQQKLADDKKLEEEIKDRGHQERLHALRRLVEQGKYEDALKEADALLVIRPRWREVETIKDLARHEIDAKELKQAFVKNELTDTRALVQVEETAALPEDPGTIPRPEIKVFPLATEASNIKEKLQQKVSVNLVEADLGYVLDLLFRATGVNIIANPEALGENKITIHVEQIPLKDLLHYITVTFGLSFSASQNAVWVSTPDQPYMETQIRQLSKGLTDVSEELESQTSDIEKLLERIAELIEWPDGSTYYLDRKKNVLFLRSTPETLVKANELLDVIDQPPLQILIETRFVELQTDDFKDFSIDMNLTSNFSLTRSGNNNKIQVDAGAGTELSSQGVGSMRPSSMPAPNATGNFDGLDLTVSGVLTDPQFQIIIKALEDSKKAKTLSAPRILAMNNYTSEIEVVQSLIYIEDYEVDRADISGTTVGVIPGQQNAGSGTVSSEPIIIPQFAQDEDIGFKFRVTPSVGADHNQISLVLEPEITEQVDELSFPLTIPNFTGTTPVITRPIVSTRKLRSKVTVDDGSILALAGLIRQAKGKRVSKVPLLGDIPYLGLLFRHEGDFNIRTNLLIFVKATIIDGQGRRYSSGASIERAGNSLMNRPVASQ